MELSEKRQDNYFKTRFKDAEGIIGALLGQFAPITNTSIVLNHNNYLGNYEDLCKFRNSLGCSTNVTESANAEQDHEKGLVMSGIFVEGNNKNLHH